MNDGRYRKLNDRWARGIKFIKRNGRYARSVIKGTINKDAYREMKAE